MVGIVDPETKSIYQQRDNDSQPDHHHLRDGRRTGSQRESQSRGKKSASQCGEQFEVGDAPDFWDVLNVPEDRPFPHAYIATENCGHPGSRMPGNV